MKYRTKPVEIEATQFNKQGDHPAVENFGSKTGVISTRQGTVVVNKGDFIITLADGESYPCHPDVFHSKYEPV